MSSSEYGFGTKAIHVGCQPEKWDMNQVVPPISVATTYKQREAGEPKVHDYSRAGNPTRDVLEENLAVLENAKYCRTYSSGMAAVMSLTNYLTAGDHIVCSDDGYGGTQRYFRTVSVKKHGLVVDMVDLTDFDKVQRSLSEKTKMIWFETPSNPLLKVIDIRAIAKIAADFNSNILVIVDNTFLTPYFQRPLELGAHVVLHSLTKYINGHSDVVMGAVMTNDEKIGDHLRYMQLAVGAVTSPFDSYLVIRGLKTLHLRMRAHAANGLAVAKFLEANPRVEKVIYPELESHPHYAIHKFQTTGMSGIISFYVRGGLAEAKAVLANLKIFILAESLGGCDSLAELPSIMTHASVPAEERAQLGIHDNLIRLSVGVEDLEDLIRDLDRALKLAIPSS